jgi:hypothetical protein
VTAGVVGGVAVVHQSLAVEVGGASGGLLAHQASAGAGVMSSPQMGQAMVSAEVATEWSRAQEEQRK